MTGGRRFVYEMVRSAIRAYQRLFFDLRVRGQEHIPSGPKVYVLNHITSTDAFWSLPILPDPLHFVIGPGYQSKLTGRLLDYMEQINAMPDHRATVVDEAVAYLRRGEAIYIMPEGDIQPLLQFGRFYPGMAKIYRRIQVPIVPIALHAPPSALWACPRLDLCVDGRVYKSVNVLRGPFHVNIGKPYRPELDRLADEREDNERIMDELKQRLRDLVSEIVTSPSSM